MRVRDKTKKKIANSMMSLVKKKSIDKITITDITVNCNMTRPIFYRYFIDKYDLINWMYKEDCDSIMYTGEEYFSLELWIKYIVEFINEKKEFYVYSIKDETGQIFENLILDRTRAYLTHIVEYKISNKITKQLEFLIEMTSRALIDMFMYEIEKEMPIKEEILVSWLMNGISKEIWNLVYDCKIPMAVVKKWKI